jgi:hypothetical protein
MGSTPSIDGSAAVSGALVTVVLVEGRMDITSVSEVAPQAVDVT